MHCAFAFLLCVRFFFLLLCSHYQSILSKRKTNSGRRYMDVFVLRYGSGLFRPNSQKEKDSQEHLLLTENETPSCDTMEWGKEISVCELSYRMVDQTMTAWECIQIYFSSEKLYKFIGEKKKELEELMLAIFVFWMHWVVAADMAVKEKILNSSDCFWCLKVARCYCLHTCITFTFNNYY